jgi:hypothetical protein
MDGYVGLFLVPDEGAPVCVMNNPTVTITEVVETAESKMSTAKFDITNIDITAGMLKSISIGMRKSALPAINYVIFGGSNGQTNVNDGDTVTVNARVYTFKNTLAATDQIKIGANVFETALNFLKTINLTGIVGTNYYTGQTINAHFTALSDGLMITLRAKTAGTAGNSDTLATSASTRIRVYAATAFGGAAVEANYQNIGSFEVALSVGNDQTATIKVPNIPSISKGMYYDFELKYYNPDGQRAVDSGASVITSTVTANEFDGISDLAEFVEVTGLVCANAANQEGDAGTPSALPAGGLARLQWDDMKRFTRLTSHPIAAPSASGAQTQSTGDVSEAQIAGITEYVVFMFISTSGSAPQCDWVRPVDANGTWYLIGRTSNNYMEIQCPKNKKIGFWVGFGTQGTIGSTVLPFSQKLDYAHY